jgi:hypothetical protein
MLRNFITFRLIMKGKAKSFHTPLYTVMVGRHNYDTVRKLHAEAEETVEHQAYNTM